MHTPNRIYFDNAATTPLSPEVLEAMMPYLTTHFGNPSSIYSYGRESRLAVENARKSVARILNVHPAEIFFTSGGTESSNTAIISAVRDLGCVNIITSPIEHHATLHTVEYLHSLQQAHLEYVKIDERGYVDVAHLEALLQQLSGKTLVTLLHANNEIGVINDASAIGEICRRYNALFHCDMVQTVGHYKIDLRTIPVDFISAAGHKFHGPKGVGILYINENIKIKPLMHGGAQERNMRAGTENLYGIVGFAKALEIADKECAENEKYINDLRFYMMEQLSKNFDGIVFNGDPTGNCLYTVLSVGFPVTDKTEMLLFNLDIHNICASGGSACSSGAMAGSHVINAICHHLKQTTIRFSFSRYNTKQEIDRVIEVLKTLL